TSFVMTCSTSVGARSGSTSAWSWPVSGSPSGVAGRDEGARAEMRAPLDGVVMWYASPTTEAAVDGARPGPVATPGAKSACWALSAYPISAAYRKKAESLCGHPLEVATMSELLSQGARSFLARVSRVRSEVGYVVTEDPSALPLLPPLRGVLAMTRCRRLA